MKLEASAAVQFPDYVAALAWRPDSAMVAVACADGSVHEMLAHGGASAPVRVHGAGACAVGYAIDGTLASAGEDGRVAIGPLPPQPAGAGWIEQLAWSPDGALVASAVGRRVQLWRSDGTLVAETPPQPATVECLAWAPEGARLALGGHGGVGLLDRDGAPFGERLEWTGVVVAMAWSPDGRRLACGMQDMTVWIWDLEAREATTMTGYARKVRELAWSADGRWLATGGGRALAVWHGARQLELRGHDAPVVWVGFQPGGPLLASAAEDGMVILWGLPRDRPLTAATISEPAGACAWSPDGTMLALGGESGRVAVFACHSGV